MALSSQQLDRALGCVLASALGDALGAPYEFKPALRNHTTPELKRNQMWGKGEWTDDTTMATSILLALANDELNPVPGSPTYTDFLNQIVDGWVTWASSAPKDIGTQTSAVFQKLGTLRRTGAAGPNSALCHRAALDHHQEAGRSAGNGSLMRSSGVVIASLSPQMLALYPQHEQHQVFADFPQDYLEAVTTLVEDVSSLTHIESDATEACVLFTLCALNAVLGAGVIGMAGPLGVLEADRRELWSVRLKQAASIPPWEVPENNYWVVGAALCAYSAINASINLADALTMAVQSGEDTDTVAAITGILAGASYGASTAPGQWRRYLHGYPQLSGQDLLNIALSGLTRGTPDTSWPKAKVLAPTGAPICAAHPGDSGLLVGNLGGLQNLPSDVDAIVSLCRVGTEQIPQKPNREHFALWLIDRPNQNIDTFIALTQAAQLVKELRDEGKKVFLHCQEGISRTPSVAAAYAMMSAGITANEALAELRPVLPHSKPGWYFTDALNLLEEQLEPARNID